MLENARNYNRWIAETMLESVAPPVIEIGAGTGNISELLASHHPLHVTEGDPELVRHLERKFEGRAHTGLEVSQYDLSDAAPERLKGRFASAVAVNVLEHIADDVGALRNIRDLLLPGGRAVLLVPARQAAYTRLDKLLGHYRRYEKDELEEKLRMAGYQVERIRFFNIVGLASWVVRDRLTRSSLLKPYQVSLFEGLVPLLKHVERICPPPVGISLVATGRRID